MPQHPIDAPAPAPVAPVTVAVISWNTRALLLRCLNSLEDEVRQGRAEVWVVDNASCDGSAEAARDAAPWAHVLEPGENLGFGRAANAVAERSSLPWLACANADVALEPGALAGLLEAGEDPRVGCVAPRLILPDGSTQASLNSFPTIPFSVALNLGLPLASRRLADRMLIPGRYEVERPRDVPWAIGAFLLFRRRAFDEVGGFDERQWMYAEDLDLEWRLARAGWRTRYVPSARVRHAASAATRDAFGPETRSRSMRATYGTLLRRRGRARARVTAAVNVLGALLRVLVWWPLTLGGRRRGWRLTENRQWLQAHLQGLRPESALRGDGSRSEPQ